LYTSVPETKVEATVRQSWSTIVSALFPKALLSHRTALEFKPNSNDEIFLTSKTNREVTYPGLRFKFVRGPAPLNDDPKFLSLHHSSRPRAFLENLSTTRPSSKSKILLAAEIEKRLEQILHVEGEVELNRVRDRAREIALEFGWKLEMSRLDKVIGGLLGTRHGGVVSPVGQARAVGEPFDAPCLERLQLLFGELRTRPIAEITNVFPSNDHFKNKAFFEAYFSNYIEGTTFEIEEAEEIIFDRRIPEKRPQDAHDIVGTYAIVSSPSEMRRTPRTVDELFEILRARHRTMLEQRPEAEPGVFKTRPNRAGETVFVHPEYVVGTLRKGFELYVDLPAGIRRAIFAMFLVADVHPFVDGNGRLARVMMNSELVSTDQSTIIVPNVYREDYLLTLRSLTRRNRPTPMIDMLLRAQSFSNLDFSKYPPVLAEIQSRNWFKEPDEARIVR
jgi:fido (protein-threonine AMPylation protein)